MAGKRPYRLGKRKASVDETRRRIVEAAGLEYQDNGIENTSMQAVARRADVAAGTVLYHYPTPEDLADAVVESWTEQLRAPSSDAIDPDAPLAERVSALVRELFGLFERSEWAYQVYQKSPDHPSLAKGNQWWEENVGSMLFAALGERAQDSETVQVISALTNPGFRGTLLETGLSSERAVEVATRLALGWLGEG
ncbi:MAG: TetR/AcrR family transcriptional regulator [Acidimicrobiia bacterium]